MLTIDEMRDQFRQMKQNADDALRVCIPEGFKPTLGKHEAVNHASMKRVIAEAQAACPDAAATIAWLLWHKSLDWQHMSLLLEPDPIAP